MATVNAITANGISIQTQTDILNSIINGTSQVPGLIQIYGSGINVNSNSPDGQLINIFALSKVDIEQLCVNVYNSFDPDQAVGSALDAVSQYCGITRLGGSYTTVNIVVTTSQTLTLPGIDTSTPYTIQDNIGNLYTLVSSANLSIGANTLLFQAVNIGFIQAVPNTITVPVSVVQGVVSVNNPNNAVTTGVNQETDAQLRIRRQNSVALASQGNYAGMIAALYSIPGVIQALIHENVTNTTDSNSVPPHTFWTIVDSGTTPGTSITSVVGTTIYNYRSMGVAMRGGTNVNISQADGSTFTVSFDYAVYQNLYIKFTSSPIIGSSIDKTALANALVSYYTLGIYQTAEITTITYILKASNPNALITNVGVSTDNVNFYNSVLPSSVQNRFIVSLANITSS